MYNWCNVILCVLRIAVCSEVGQSDAVCASCDRRLCGHHRHRYDVDVGHEGGTVCREVLVQQRAVLLVVQWDRLRRWPLLQGDDPWPAYMKHWTSLNFLAILHDKYVHWFDEHRCSLLAPTMYYHCTNHFNGVAGQNPAAEILRCAAVFASNVYHWLWIYLQRELQPTLYKTYRAHCSEKSQNPYNYYICCMIM